VADAAHFESFNVVSDALLIDFRRQAVIAFIAGHEGFQGTALDEILNGVQFRIITGIRSDIGDIYIIKSGEVIEVEDVILDDMSAVNHIAHDTAVIRDFISDAEGAIEIECSGDTMGLGADAADALGDNLGITRVTPSENELEAAEEITGCPGILNDAVFDNTFNL